jgi:putative ABC transport system permease protein
VLGASVIGIVRMLSTDFIKPVIIAGVIAFPMAGWLMNQWLEGFAYRVSVGWGVFAAAGVFALTIAFITVSFQAIKAAVANPMQSLRTE